MYNALTENDSLYSYTPTLTGQVSYTPIVIQFVPPILYHDNTPVVKKDTQQGYYYYLRISCPESNKIGTLATLPETYIIPIPQDGLLRLQLVPTTTLLPEGYYIVDYFRSNSKKPLMTQHWAVPELSPTAKNSYSFNYESSTTSLPLDVWEVLSLNSNDTTLGYTWRALYNSLFWDTPQPILGTAFTVVYKQALTLKDVVLHNALNYDRSRVRY